MRGSLNFVGLHVAVHPRNFARYHAGNKRLDPTRYDVHGMSIRRAKLGISILSETGAADDHSSLHMHW